MYFVRSHGSRLLCDQCATFISPSLRSSTRTVGRHRYSRVAGLADCVTLRQDFISAELLNMVLKLYGVALSTCTIRAALVLAELKVPFELIEIDFMKGEHKSADWLKKQPFGQVPYLDDDGFILYESRAICRYLAVKHKSKLIPSDPKEQALFEQAASIEYTNFDPIASKAVYEMMYKHLHGLKSDPVIFAKLIDTLDAKLAAYNVILANQKYLAGNEITLADLFHVPYGTKLEMAGSKVMFKYKNVERWWNDLTSRPSWQSVKDGAKSTA